RPLGFDGQLETAVIARAVAVSPSLDGADGAEGAHVELFVSYHLAVVVERLLARGLVGRRDQRVTADLQTFGRGEERHVGGITGDCRRDRALLQDDVAEARPLG